MQEDAAREGCLENEEDALVMLGADRSSCLGRRRRPALHPRDQRAFNCFGRANPSLRLTGLYILQDFGGKFSEHARHFLDEGVSAGASYELEKELIFLPAVPCHRA